MGHQPNKTGKFYCGKLKQKEKQIKEKQKRNPMGGLLNEDIEPPPPSSYFYDCLRREVALDRSPQPPLCLPPGGAPAAEGGGAKGDATPPKNIGSTANGIRSVDEGARRTPRGGGASSATSRHAGARSHLAAPRTPSACLTWGGSRPDRGRPAHFLHLPQSWSNMPSERNF